jgi:hypothetical protein
LPELSWNSSPTTPSSHFSDLPSSTLASRKTCVSNRKPTPHSCRRSTSLLLPPPISPREAVPKISRPRPRCDHTRHLFVIYKRGKVCRIFAYTGSSTRVDPSTPTLPPWRLAVSARLSGTRLAVYQSSREGTDGVGGSLIRPCPLPTLKTVADHVSPTVTVSLTAFLL